MFDENIKFKYTWRPYQKKVLNEADKYIKDKRINIVAAPGSGKTVLGLELARRLGNPTLILSPTITIKNQWIDRLVSHFMQDGIEKPAWISDSVYHLSYFNSVTYQGLHYAYKRKKIINRKNIEETDDEIEVEKIETDVDIKEYDIVKEIKDKKITTIVLDEAHHLKSEWWQSLINILNELKDITIISLTATPPYDVEYNEWKRYVKLCGDIDMEISVPELVEAKNLCPHQDYIYFSYPTKEEKKAINDYLKEVNNFISSIKTDNEFINIIKKHPYIENTDLYIEEILDNAKLYSSMIIFLNEVEPNSISNDKVKILGHNSNIPRLDAYWLEILMQNILFNDLQYFKKYDQIVEKIESNLNKIRAIEKRQVHLVKNPMLEKYFVNSISKLDSINKIVASEYSNLKQDLRLVILTDFLRKEYLFEDSVDKLKIGVFPIFLNLLKQNPDINMAVLTGSIFMIPNCKQEKLIVELINKGITKKDIEFVSLEKTPTYCIVKCTHKHKNVVMKCISKLFNIGEINVIIGTKSLLGEGWDEPSINSLILASFVGSFMLSNQMRGRAIRTNENPNKTANIWHLVSVLEPNTQWIDNVENTDLEMLKRRFKSFVGIGYNLNVIENGMERLDIVPYEFTKQKIDEYNKQIFKISNNRTNMYDRWFKLLKMYGGKKIEITNQLETEKKNMKNNFALLDIASLLKAIVTYCIVEAVCSSFRYSNSAKEFFIQTAFLILFTLIINFKLIIRFIRAIRFTIPNNQFKAVAMVVVKSLIDAKIINTPYRKISLDIKEDKQWNKLRLQIKGVTSQENNLITESLKQIFDNIEDQRYILINKKKGVLTYYSVPEVLATNKEMAGILHKNWDKYIGNCKLVYTRSIKGRKVLLDARKKSFNYVDIDKFISKKKPVSKWG